MRHGWVADGFGVGVTGCFGLDSPVDSGDMSGSFVVALLLAVSLDIAFVP